MKPPKALEQIADTGREQVVFEGQYLRSNSRITHGRA